MPPSLRPERDDGSRATRRLNATLEAMTEDPDRRLLPTQGIVFLDEVCDHTGLVQPDVERLLAEARMAGA